MGTILRANGKSVSGKTFYFNADVPAGVVTVVAGSLNGTASSEFCEIENIQWMYNFRKKNFSITKNGKNKVADFVEVIKKFYKAEEAAVCQEK